MGPAAPHCLAQPAPPPPSLCVCGCVCASKLLCLYRCRKDRVQFRAPSPPYNQTSLPLPLISLYIYLYAVLCCSPLGPIIYRHPDPEISGGGGGGPGACVRVCMCGRCGAAAEVPGRGSAAGLPGLAFSRPKRTNLTLI